MYDSPLKGRRITVVVSFLQKNCCPFGLYMYKIYWESNVLSLVWLESLEKGLLAGMSSSSSQNIPKLYGPSQYNPLVTSKWYANIVKVKLIEKSPLCFQLVLSCQIFNISASSPSFVQKKKKVLDTLVNCLYMTVLTADKVNSEFCALHLLLLKKLLKSNNRMKYYIFSFFPLMNQNPKCQMVSTLIKLC